MYNNKFYKEFVPGSTERGGFVNKTEIVDSETGEILRSRSWVGYDGFNDIGYKYRSKQEHIRVYMDAIPDDLSKRALILLIYLAKVAYKDNTLVRKVHVKSLFQKVKFIPLRKEDIYARIQDKFTATAFRKGWDELYQHKCIARVPCREGKCTWVINPAYVNGCNYVTYWMYSVFHDYMDPYMSKHAIEKMNTRLQYLTTDEYKDPKDL